MKIYTSLTLLLCFIMPASAALVWTGAGDGISLYAEANWLDDNGAVPTANQVNANTAITATTGGTIEINSGTGSPSAFGGNFVLGANDLLVGGGKVLASTGTSGMTGTSPASFSVTGASTVNLQFIVGLDISVDAGSVVRFRGGGNPVNGTTLDFLDTTSVLQFSAETYPDFAADHSGKVTYNGASLIFGTDPAVVEPGDNAFSSVFNGATGIQINFVAVPEPGTSLLAALGTVALIFRRRR